MPIEEDLEVRLQPASRSPSMMSLPCLRSRLRRSAFCSLAVLAFSASPLLYGQSVTYTGSTPALDFGSVNVCPSGATSPAPCSKTLN